MFPERKDLGVSTGEITDDHLNGSGSGILMSEQLAGSIRVLRRRWRVIALVPLVALVVSLGVSLTAHKEYSATAKLQLIPANENPVGDLVSPGSQFSPPDPEADQNTAVSQITETPMANLVRGSLRLTESSQDLLAQVSASLAGTSNIVNVTATDASPARAARIANAFASQYVGFSQDSERSQLEQALRSAQARFAALTPAQQAAAGGQQLLKTELTLSTAIVTLTPDATVAQTASTPSSPSSPKPLVDALVALVVGLLVGIVAAIVLELFDRSVRDEEDAAATARLPSLGVIPKPPALAKPNRPGLRGHPPASPDPHRGAYSQILASADSFVIRRSSDWEQEESYSSLAVSLLALRLGAEQNVVMITSPGPQDGKTSVTLGLAAALAEVGQRVIAVECDLRRPRFAEYLGLPPATDGLSSLLSGSATLPAGLLELGTGERRALAAKTGVRARTAKNAATTTLQSAPAHLTVMPCGPIPTRPLALLGGPEMAPLMRQLQSMADIVLIDTPPLSVIKDAMVMASMVDQVALVARIGHTSRDALRRCRDAVEQLGSPMVGIVTVGGPRGGILEYYGRGPGAAALVETREPTFAFARPREEPVAPPAEIDPQPETPEPARTSKGRAEPGVAAEAKASRPRRRGSPNSVG